MAAEPELNIAPIGRRVVAGLINGAIFGTSAVVGLGVSLTEERWPDAYSRLVPLGRVVKRAADFMNAPAWRRVAIGLTDAVVLRNRPSPGARLVGIRRADARTGGPVSVRSAATRYAAKEAQAQLVKPLALHQVKRAQGLQGAVEEARQRHPDDEVAASRATMEVYKHHDVNPLGCLWVLVPAALNALVMLSVPRHQSLVDWVAGIVVVRD
jgi:uncharacterized RDD family membrane protein YckC